MVGKARDRSPQLIRVGSLVPTRDGTVDTVFHGHAEHIPVEQPVREVQVVERAEAESVDSSEAEVEDPGATMVVRCTMIADQFLPGSQQAD